MTFSALDLEWYRYRTPIKWVYVDSGEKLDWRAPPDNHTFERVSKKVKNNQYITPPGYYLAVELFKENGGYASDSAPYRPDDGEYSLLFDFLDTYSMSNDVPMFAQKWGFLGAEKFLVSEIDPENSEKIKVYSLEAGFDWVEANCTIHEILRILTSFERNDVDNLKDLVVWPDEFEEGPRHKFIHSDGFEMAPEILQFSDFSSDEVQNWLSSLSHGEILRPAKLIAIDKLNQKLKKGFSARVKYGPETEELSFQLRPTSLKTAIFLQLANLLTSSVGVKICQVCSKWFVLNPGQGRNDKQYCSNACKMRAYRARKKEKAS